MTKRDILSVAFRIIGVYLAIFAIVSIPMIIFSLASQGQMQQSGMIIPPRSWVARISIQLNPILMFGFALALLKWADSLAAKLIKEDSAVSMPQAAADTKQVFVLALRIIGVMQIVAAAPGLIANLLRLLPLGAMSRSAPGFNLPELIVRLLIGIYLLSGAKHLVAIVFRKEA
jgi:hypothetical protein